LKIEKRKGRENESITWTLLILFIYSNAKLKFKKTDIFKSFLGAWQCCVELQNLNPRQEGNNSFWQT
jgi:hypothetical protein